MLLRKKRIPVLHMLFIGILPSFLKKAVYRMKGYRIGKNVKLSFGCVVMGRKVEIKDGVQIGYLTIIRCREISIGRFVKIGSMSVIDTEKIFIDEDARINEQVFIGGMKTPESSFHLGKRSIVMQLSYINPTLPIFIDDDSGIGGHCLLFTHGSWNSQLEGFPVRFAPIRLGKKVWLPWRVFIMPGVTIGDNVVIGANSMISSDIPANTFAAGSPAKVIRRDVPVAPEQKAKQEMLKNIFGDFFAYLRYEEFECKVNEVEDGFVAEIKGGNSGWIRYTLSQNQIEGGDKNTMLIIFQADSTILNESKEKGFGMVVSLSSNQRIGSNAAGEEMVTFFSRYGVRFDRLD